MPKAEPITDAEFNGYLDHLIAATRSVVNKDPVQDYFTTVFVLRATGNEIHLLRNETPGDVAEDSDDPIQLCREFGQGLSILVRTSDPHGRRPASQGADSGAERVHTAPSRSRLAELRAGRRRTERPWEFGEEMGRRRRTVPDAVFVSAETLAGDAGEAIAICGSTPDGRRNLAYLPIRRDELGRITVEGEAECVYSRPGEPEISDHRNPSATVLAGILHAVGGGR